MRKCAETLPRHHSQPGLTLLPLALSAPQPHRFSHGLCNWLSSPTFHRQPSHVLLGSSSRSRLPASPSLLSDFLPESQVLTQCHSPFQINTPLSLGCALYTSSISFHSEQEAQENRNLTNSGRLEPHTVATIYYSHGLG